MVSPAELEYIRAEQTVTIAADRPAKPKRDPRLARPADPRQKGEARRHQRRHLALLEHHRQRARLFLHGSASSMSIMSWIPTYLVSEKGFATMKMGFVSAAPFRRRRRRQLHRWPDLRPAPRQAPASR